MSITGEGAVTDEKKRSAMGLPNGHDACAEKGNKFCAKKGGSKLISFNRKSKGSSKSSSGSGDYAYR